MPRIENAKIAILSTDGFEQSELMVPKKTLADEGAEITVISIKTGQIKGWKDGNWGESVDVDMLVGDAKVADFDALVIPGGQINPDILRTDAAAVKFVAEFFESGKTLAAICHAPWLLVEADVLKDRNVTSYNSIRKDLENAGAIWHDEAVVTDAALITSRSPEDLEAFCAKIVEEVEEGRHRRSAA